MLGMHLTPDETVRKDVDFRLGMTRDRTCRENSAPNSCRGGLSGAVEFDGMDLARVPSSQLRHAARVVFRSEGPAPWPARGPSAAVGDGSVNPLPVQ
jgi:hypothetical protein